MAESASPQQIDLWETAIQAFERHVVRSLCSTRNSRAGRCSVLIRCPAESAPFVADVVAMCLTMLELDPNYTYEAEVRTALARWAS
jgi:hypothetical protein